MYREDSGRRTFYVTLVAVFVIVVGILVFNRHGLMAVADLKQGGDSISTEIDSLRATVDSLEREIERLETDSLFMEKMVREILNWGMPGEYVVRFVSPKGERPR